MKPVRHIKTRSRCEFVETVSSCLLRYVNEFDIYKKALKVEEVKINFYIFEWVAEQIL